MTFETSDFLNRVARNPSGGPTPSAIDAFLAGAEAGQLGTSDAVNAEIYSQVDRLRREMKEQGIQPPDPPIPSGGPVRPAQPGATRRAGPATTLDEELDRFFEEVQRKTEGQNVAFPTSRSGLMERVRQGFQQSNEEFQETMARAGTFGTGAGIAGQFAGATVDPIVLATLPFGVGAASTVTRAAVIEAGIAGASEIPIQAIAQSRRADVGLPSGVGRAAKNVALAAVGAGVLGGGVRAAGKGIGALGDAARRLKQTREFESADSRVNAAASITERSEEFESQNPTAQTPTARAEFQEAQRVDVDTIRSGGINSRTTEAPIREEELQTDVTSGASATAREAVKEIADGEQLAALARQRVRERSRTRQAELTQRAVLNEIDDPDAFARTLGKVQRIRREARTVQRLRDEAEQASSRQVAAGKKSQATRKERAIRQQVQQDPDLREALSDTDELVPNLARGEDEFAQSVEALRRTVGVDADEVTPEQTATAIRVGQQRQQSLREQEVRQAQQGHNRTLSSAQRNEARQEGEGEQTAEQIMQENQQIKDQMRAEIEALEEGEEPPMVLREDGEEEIPLNEALDELDQDEDILREIDGCLGGRSA